MTKSSYRMPIGTRNSDETVSDLIVQVLRRLVSTPNAVSSHFLKEGSTTTLVATVSGADLEGLTGNNGRVSRSLRGIVREIGERSGRVLDFDLQASPEA